MDILNKNLKIFIKILEQTQEKKYPIILSGSTSLALQGVEVTVHDIDIVADKVGALDLDEMLKEYCVKKNGVF